MKKIFSIVLYLCTISFFVIMSFSCTKTNTQSSNINIVATSFPCYDFIREILFTIQDDGRASNVLASNDEVSVKLLLKPGTELHSFDPSPTDIIAINKADLFVYIGGESDEWVEQILSSIDNKNLTILKLIDFVPTLDELIVEGMEGDEQEEDEHEIEEHDHEADEHIWTSSKNAVLMIKALKDSICKIDTVKNNGKNINFYTDNTNKFCSQINTNSEMISQIVNSASSKYIIVGDRFPLRYFADEYGLTYSAAFVGCSSAVEAKTSTIAYLIQQAQANQVKGIYSIELSNQKIAKSIAEQVGLPVLELHSCHNVTKTDFDNGFTYITAMKQNQVALSKGLK